MNTIRDGYVVSIAYILESKSGLVYEQQVDKPLDYLHGSNNLICGLEEALNGRNLGDEFTIEISADKGYGPRIDEAPTVYSLSIFVDKIPLKVGTPIFGDSFNGNVISGWITSIDKDTFTVDQNHPLAGQDVVFKLSVLAIRSATQQEIADGYAHVGANKG